MTKLYLVGGAVRDQVMGIESTDLDFVVVGPQNFGELEQYLDSRGVTPFVKKPQFLTITGRDPAFPGKVDFVLPRTEADYSDGRRPDQTGVGTLEEDLSRRDFTMNAMAKDMDSGEIVDLYEGRKHLREGMLHTVGPARDRFSEDSLRMLRALRFAVTKKMSFSNDIHYALMDFDIQKKLTNVSVERVREEFLKMLKVDWVKTFRLLDSYRLSHFIQTTFRDLWFEPTLKQR